jgi:hypothetical protein
MIFASAPWLKLGVKSTDACVYSDVSTRPLSK